MAGRTVTRADLSEAVYQKDGLSRTESAALVELVLDEICDCLTAGATVKLFSFGSFLVRDKGQRVGRNPKTGIEVPIEPRRVMVFKPSNVLKAPINGIEPGDAELAPSVPAKRPAPSTRARTPSAPSARAPRISTCRSTCCASGR